ncbi:MAG: prepilin-type N-terminal cleavage/methylation domain-containing protein [Leptolyngbya sp. Prado105]|jgi:prepilin-type N-terminal cleavage/methylation domain-containing protein|nr:prepilin-type N-terminal cleavage/methylation domain-containing protein [Leptolyngbya sp. Prado105]
MKRRSFSGLRFNTQGFTLLELIVVMALIGVLFAIAAPNWVAFLNQQRVGAARNQVSQAMRTAQAEAKRTKINRAVVFENNNNQPRYAIVPAPGNVVNLSNVNWQNLGDGTLQAGLIRLSGNHGTDSSRPASIIFDSYGSVVTSALPSPLPYRITIGATSSTNPRRCVNVTTLLGAIEENSNQECDN